MKKAESQLDTIRKKLKDLAQKKRKFWQPTVGQNLVRFLSYREDRPFYKEFRQHFIPWAGEAGSGVSVGCLEPFKGVGQCPACELASFLQVQENPQDVELGKRIAPFSRYFYNIVDLNNPDQGVQIFASYSDVILESLLGYFVDPECGDFTDPKTGRNVVLLKVDRGKTAPPKYEVKVKMKSTPLPELKWLKEVRDLDKLFTVPSLAEMMEILGDAAAPIRDKFGVSKTSSLTQSKKEQLIVSLPCFGKKYRKLPQCPSCPVRLECKKATRKKSSTLIEKVRKRIIKV